MSVCSGRDSRFHPPAQSQQEVHPPLHLPQRLHCPPNITTPQSDTFHCHSDQHLDRFHKPYVLYTHLHSSHTDDRPHLSLSHTLH